MMIITIIIAVVIKVICTLNALEHSTVELRCTVCHHHHHHFTFVCCMSWLVIRVQHTVWWLVTASSMFLHTEQSAIYGLHYNALQCTTVHRKFTSWSIKLCAGTGHSCRQRSTAQIVELLLWKNLCALFKIVFWTPQRKTSYTTLCHIDLCTSSSFSFFVI